MEARCRAASGSASDCARAFYGNPRLLVLDEPNSNLDSNGERALAKALLRAKEKRMTVVDDHPAPALLHERRQDHDPAMLEVQMLARACGKTNVHSLEPEDLCALTVEAAAMAKVPLAGTSWIPGVTEEQALGEDQADARAPPGLPRRLPARAAGLSSRRGGRLRWRSAVSLARSTPSTCRAGGSPTRRTSRSSRMSTWPPRPRGRTSTGSRMSSCWPRTGRRSSTGTRMRS